MGTCCGGNARVNNVALDTYGFVEHPVRLGHLD